MSDVFEESHLENQFIYDYGTVNLSVGYQPAQPGEKPDMTKARRLHLQIPGKEEVPQKLGFIRLDGEWRFTWGWELDDLQRKMPEDDIVVFEWLKMCLYGAEGASEYADSITERLAQIGFPNRGPEWLLELHLKEIQRAAHADALRCFPAISIRNPANFIAVPEVSDPNTCRMMMMTAKAAGFKNARPISETEAAAGWAVHKLVCDQPPRKTSDADTMVGLHCCRYESPDTDMRQGAGDEMVVADGGGMTVVSSSSSLQGIQEPY